MRRRIARLTATIPSSLIQCVAAMLGHAAVGRVVYFTKQAKPPARLFGFLPRFLRPARHGEDEAGEPRCHGRARPCGCGSIQSVMSSALISVVIASEAKQFPALVFRSEERRVGKGCVYTCRSLW